jgi:hypothetical protein
MKEKEYFFSIGTLEVFWHTFKFFFLICIVGGEIKVHSTLRAPMAYCASPGWLWWWRNRWNDWQGKPKYSEKTCSSAAVSTSNPTCCPYANPGRRGSDILNKTRLKDRLQPCKHPRAIRFGPRYGEACPERLSLKKSVNSLTDDADHFFSA